MEMDPLGVSRGRLGASKESIFNQELRLARRTLLAAVGVGCDLRSKACACAP